jgi:hypothetical protein
MECGMSPRHRNILSDPALRAAGLTLIILAVLALHLMVGLVHLRPPHEASMGEMALAAAGFLGLSAGSTLITLGTHIFDEIAISERWMLRPGHPFAQLPVTDGEGHVARNDNPASLRVQAMPRAAPRRMHR